MGLAVLLVSAVGALLVAVPIRAGLALFRHFRVEEGDSFLPELTFPRLFGASFLVIFVGWITYLRYGVEW